MLTGLMLSGSVYCVVDAGQKTQKYRNFEQIFTSPLVPIPLYRSEPFWQETVYPPSMLTRQISFESVCYITFQGRETPIWGKD